MRPSGRRVLLAATVMSLGIAIVCGLACSAVLGDLSERQDRGPDAGGGAPGMVDAGPEEAGPKCGLAYAGTSCEACLEGACCAEALACANDEACLGLEGCLGACSGDPACRAQCVSDHRIGPDPAETQLAACLAAHCAQPCGIVCGGFAQMWGADAATGCQTCISKNFCAVGQTCAVDPECQAQSWCRQIPELDQLEACQYGYDAGPAPFHAFVGDVTTSCANECAWGSQWWCVGNMPAQPIPVQVTKATFALYDEVTNAPTVGASLQICDPIDPACTRPIVGGTSGPDGRVTVSIPSSTLLNGPVGYALVSGTGLIPTLNYWGYPLTAPNLLYYLATFKQADINLLKQLTPVPVDLTRALVTAIAFDCDFISAPGVTFSVSPSDANTRVIYVGQDGLPTTGLSATTAAGTALIVNVPVDAGPLTITETPRVLGQPSSILQRGILLPGTITQFAGPVTQ
jgi:hypothetical protein